MLRGVDLSEISDGKRYTANDMAKVDTKNCEGCSNCCKDMGTSIILDPFDVYRLTNAFDCTFEKLLENYLELNVVDGVILPNLRMQPDTNSCAFLNEEGRCTIHASRPGLCRMFPLGRVYEENDFYYILQIHECPAAGKTKVKIRKWLDTPNLSRYEKFVKDWHFFLKEMADVPDDQAKAVNMAILKLFFISPWSEAFFEEFDKRMEAIKSSLR